jgi:hypothetical protein
MALGDGTKGLPSQGPRDRRGFLRRGMLALDFAPVFIGGAAIGVATGAVDAQLLETAAGSGIAVAGSDSQLLEAAGATGVAVASATDQEAEAASGAGVALALADSLLLIGGSAIGESGSLLNLPNGVAIGAANSSADPMLLAGGAATGQADAGADTPPEDLALDQGDGLPGYRTAPWVAAPVTAMVAGGKARGESAAAAMAIEIWPAPAVVSIESKDDDLELAFFFDLAAA